MISSSTKHPLPLTFAPQNTSIATASAANLQRDSTATLATGGSSKELAPSDSLENIPREHPTDDTSQRHQDVLSVIKGTAQLPERFISEYIMGQLLGDGAFGFVMTATRKSDGKEVGGGETLI